MSFSSASGSDSNCGLTYSATGRILPAQVDLDVDLTELSDGLVDDLHGGVRHPPPHGGQEFALVDTLHGEGLVRDAERGDGVPLSEFVAQDDDGLLHHVRLAVLLVLGVGLAHHAEREIDLRVDQNSSHSSPVSRWITTPSSPRCGKRGTRSAPSRPTWTRQWTG